MSMMERELRGRIAELEDQVSLYEEEIINLKKMLEPPPWNPPSEFNLTKMEGEILRYLFGADRPLSRLKLYDYLYVSEGDNSPYDQVITVLVCKLRRKIKAFGIEIETRKNLGYILTPVGRCRLKNWENE